MKKSAALLLVTLLLMSACGTAPDTTVHEPTSVTLAVFGDGYYDIENAALNFNHSGKFPEYKVVVEDYCEGNNDINYARTRLNTELGAGNGPDMIAFIGGNIQFESKIGITHMSYMARDFLVDMTEYIESDGQITRDDILFYDALNSYGGIYMIGDSFCIDSAKVLTETFGERTGWTIQEYLEIEASLAPWQSMCYYMNDHFFLENVAGRYSREAIDWENGTCDFNNQEFVSILEAAYRVKDDNTEEFETRESFTSAWQRIGAGQLMMSFSYIDEPTAMKRDEVYAGKPLTFIGWPTVDGNCGSDIEIHNAVGIVSNSRHKDVCWEFVKYMLVNANADPATAMNMPLYKPALDRMVRKCRGVDDSQGIKLTNQNEVDKFYDFLDVPENIAVYDETVVDIIIEEAEEYFAGNRTAEDAAARVQERVSLYVAEQS